MNKLGKYQIRRILGKGAMGIVYEGFDPVIERTVAIKTILPAQLAGSEVVAILARFKREAQAAGRLNHPGIVAIYDYGEELAQDISEEEATMMASPTMQAGAQRVAFIAMEFIKGRELKDHLEKNGRFPLKEVGRIMGEMLDALDHAHSLGVVHRDMKPANVILLENGRVKVADFGIARVEQSDLTQTGTIMGTPSYMSPEQFMGHPVDGRSDLFSCGVILYQLLTGEKPFTGETSTTIMYKVLREEPTPPSELNLTLTPALDFVIKKALAKAPADRFQTGRAFADALQDAIAGDITIAGTAAGATAPAPAAMAAPRDRTAASSAPAPATPAPLATAPRKPAAAMLAVGAAVVVAIGALGYVAFAPGKKSDVALAAATASAATSAALAPVPTPPATPAPPAATTEPGTMVLSAVGYVDPKEARFNGDLAAAQTEARESAKRQLVEKALALYVDQKSLDTNYGVIDKKMLVNSGGFIRTVLQETPTSNPNGLVEMQTRAIVSVRDVQKSLNDLSRQERINFIRNKGDPRISIRIDIGNAEGGNLARDRSQLAENVVKDRIKSFGFRVWAAEGDNPQAGTAKGADFAIKGEVKLKQLSMKLPASGLTITKTAITSWTLKAIETATGEEVYLSTKLPSGQTWASEDQALAEIGKLVGDEFSRNFFLEHFNFGTQKTNLVITGLPENGSAMMLRELRAMRAVLDAQAIGDGRFQLQLPDGNSGDIMQEGVLKALNAKLGQNCFALAGSQGLEVNVTYASTCSTPEMRAKFEAGAPAGSRMMPSNGGGALGRPAAASKTV